MLVLVVLLLVFPAAGSHSAKRTAEVPSGLIAFMGENGEWPNRSAVLAVMDEHGGGVRVLSRSAPRPGPRPLWLPRWSPDGSRIAVYFGRVYGYRDGHHTYNGLMSDLYIVDVASGKQTRFTRNLVDTSDGEPTPARVDGVQRFAHHPLDRPQPRLRRPAAEVGAVVLDRQP